MQTTSCFFRKSETNNGFELLNSIFNHHPKAYSYVKSCICHYADKPAKPLLRIFVM